MDPKTNLDVIQKRLTSIFNKNSQAFTGIVDSDTETISIINNETGLTCFTMPCPSYDEVEYVIYDVEIDKCCDVPKNGTQNLLNIIEFGRKYKYDLIKINNFSTINFTGHKEVGINLTLIKLLTIGNSWYSQFGFKNEFTEELEARILPFIHLTFEQFKSLGIPYFSKFFKNASSRFSRTCFQITPTKICDYFKHVESCFLELCPMRVCENIYFIKLQIVFMRKMLFFIFYAIEPCEYSKYEKIVDEKLELYVELELDFREGKGRKSKKKFINRRSHTKKAMAKNS